MFSDRSRFKLKVRVWVERGGRKLLGRGRVELLGLIDRHGSIAAAARHMNMSYRRAWMLVRDMNAVAGEPLVALSTGGARGGGARLTPSGRKALALYARITRSLARAADRAARQARG